MLFTERLHLRRFKREDIERLFEYRNDAECGRYQEWKDTSREYLEGLIERNLERDLDSEEAQLAIALKDTEELVGDLYFTKKNKSVSLGYTISTKFQRRGYMEELLKSIIPMIFKKYTDYEICCLVDPENVASSKLLIKLGFKMEEHIKEWNSDVYVMYNK